MVRVPSGSCPSTSLATVELTWGTRYSGGGVKSRAVSHATATRRRSARVPTPASALLPHSSVSGRSVTSRTVTAGTREDAAFLLDRATVGQHAAGVADERDEVEVAEGFAQAPQPTTGTHAEPVQPLTRAGVHAEHDRQPQLLRRPSDLGEHGLEPVHMVDGLLPVQRQQQITARLQAEVGTDSGGANARLVAVEYLLDRVSDHQHPVGGKALPEQVLTAAFGVGHEQIAAPVDDATIHLLGYPIVEAAVAGLHVKDRDPHTFRHVGAQRAVRVTEHQQTVRTLLFERAAGRRRQDRADALGKVGTEHAEVFVRCTDAELGKEHVAQRPLEVLPGVNEVEVTEVVESLDHAAQADDLGSRPEDDRDLHALTRRTCIGVSPGSCSSRSAASTDSIDPDFTRDPAIG